MPTRSLPGVSAFAAAAALGAQEPKPGVFAELGLAPLTRIEQVAGETGIGPALVQQLTDAGSQFPFVGAGGLAHDAPIVLLCFAGEELRDEQRVAFVLPVTDRAPPFARFRNTGKRLADDMVLLMGLPMRRTPAHVLFGGVAEVVGQADPVALGKRFADASLLAYAKLDLRAARELVPDLAEAAVKLAERNSAHDGTTARTAGYLAGQEFAAGLIRRAVRELDWAEARLVRTATGLAFVVEAAPAGLPAGKTMHAELPQGCAVRFDTPVPTALLDPLAAMIADIGMQAPRLAALADDQRAEVRRSLRTAGTSMLGDSMTFGVRQRGDALVVYAVARQPEAQPRTAQDLATALARIDEMQPRDGKADLRREHYEAGAFQVERLATDEGALDMAQRGRAICWTFASDEAHHIEELLALGQADSAQAASGDIDVGGMLALAARSAPLTPEAAEMAKRTAGLHLTWSLAPVPERQAIALRIDVPAGVVRAIAEAAGLAHK